LGALTAGDQLVELHTVRLQFDRIDDHFDQIVARTLQRGIEHAVDFLDPVAQFARGPRQSALGHIAGKRDHQNREFGDIDLVDRGLVGALRQVGLGIGNLVADVIQRL
jgi:hypothetical protein